jgi:DNA-directed RNA polymerase subunit K/omega|nr:MAG: hypothetical protein DIU54_05725 [Acidobacteriota bacterium]
MTETQTQRPSLNSFELVTIAALRARQLLEGCVPRVEGSDKPARRALQEVLAGVVTKLEDQPAAEAAAGAEATFEALGEDTPPEQVQ